MDPERGTPLLGEVTAGRDYEIWFNSPPYLNFKSINGTPAEAHQLQFYSGAR